MIERRHTHQWLTLDANITGEFQKGDRETVYVPGDFLECVKCRRGRLLPRDRRLSAVDCRKEDVT